MKKYTLIIFIALYSSSEFFAMDQKADSQELVLAQESVQSSYAKHLEPVSFTAFHQHELDPTLATQKTDGTEPLEQSLYGRFGNLPIELRHEILTYLINFTEERVLDYDYLVLERLSPQIPPALSCSGAVFTAKTEKEIESVKAFLRIQYWLQSMRKTQELPAQKYNEWKSPRVDYDQALSLASENKYRKHNFEIAALALACGANINKVLNRSIPLKNAAENDLYALSEMLLLHGAVSAPNFSPLFYAIKNDNVPMTKLFIDHGINLNDKNDLLMHTAARMNAHHVIEFLHHQGYDINANDKHLSHTSLHAAAHCKSYQVIETLLELGADPTLKDAEGKTYQDVLQDNKNQKLLRRFL